MLSFVRLRLLSASKRPLTQNRYATSYVSKMRFLNRLKQDDVACSDAMQHASIFLFHRLRPLLQRGHTGALNPPALTYADVRLVLDVSVLEESVLIGCSEDLQAQFCLDVGSLESEPLESACGGTFVDMRKAFFLLDNAMAPLLAKAQAVLRWHQSHRFCSATGEPTHRNRSGSQRVSQTGSTVYYPTMSPVVLVLVSDGKRCLLARQNSFPPGLYSALAGFCDMGESLEEALCREVAEEVGLQVQPISFSSSQHWPFPHSSFMIGCHAYVSSAHSQLDIDRSELEDARWFTLDEVISILQVKAPPRRGPAPSTWLPPSHALAHRLITEWAELQQRTDSQP